MNASTAKGMLIDLINGGTGRVGNYYLRVRGTDGNDYYCPHFDNGSGASDKFIILMSKPAAISVATIVMVENGTDPAEARAIAESMPIYDDTDDIEKNAVTVKVDSVEHAMALRNIENLDV